MHREIPKQASWYYLKILLSESGKEKPLDFERGLKQNAPRELSQLVNWLDQYSDQAVLPVVFAPAMWSFPRAARLMSYVTPVQV